MVSLIIATLSSAQVGFSAYNLYLASLSIRKLRKYEEMSEKAAEYSNIAEQQLHKTRTTQASGTLAVLLSLVSSFILLLYSLGTNTLPVLARIGLALVNTLILEGSRQHVGEFWDGKMKVPLPKTGDYNDAITITQKIKLNMAYMAYLWTGMGILTTLLSLVE